jgi:hypothetical protein
MINRKTLKKIFSKKIFIYLLIIYCFHPLLFTLQESNLFIPLSHVYYFFVEMTKHQRKICVIFQTCDEIKSENVAIHSLFLIVGVYITFQNPTNLYSHKFKKKEQKNRLWLRINVLAIKSIIVKLIKIFKKFW